MPSTRDERMRRAAPLTINSDADGHGRGQGEKPDDEQEQTAACAGNHDALAATLEDIRPSKKVADAWECQPADGPPA